MNLKKFKNAIANFKRLIVYRMFEEIYKFKIIK